MGGYNYTTIIVRCYIDIHPLSPIFMVHGESGESFEKGNDHIGDIPIFHSSMGMGGRFRRYVRSLDFLFFSLSELLFGGSFFGEKFLWVF